MRVRADRISARLRLDTPTLRRDSSGERTIMKKALLLAGALFVPVVALADVQEFKKVDVFVIQDNGDEKRKDARLEIDPDARVIRLVDEKNGAEKALYAEVAFDDITSITYERSANISKTKVLAFGIFAGKAKQHWLTIEAPTFEGGFTYMKLDKNNYLAIRRAVQAATGVKITVIQEEG